jgi:colanic acid biosynthesis glycosyl transferase WcaI
MRVLILSQYYDPEPVPKPSELAQALSENGHAVEVLTGFPNYPSGELYAGYRLHLFERSTVSGISVIRTYEYPYHGKHIVGRLLNYGSLVASMILAIPRLGSADVMYVWHPPLTIGVAAWVVSRARRIPFVYDVQDIWPESAVLSGLLRPGPLVRLISRLEKFIYKRADHILVVTDGARANLMEKGVDPKKVSVMPHWIDETLFASVPAEEVEGIREKHGWGDRFVVLFGGNLGLVQGLDTVIKAASSLDPDRIRIVLLGDGSDRERLRRLAVDLQVSDRVQFIDRHPMSAMPGFMAAADVLLVHLKRSELSRYVIPTKTFAYLAAGKPILMAMEGAAADMVQAAGAGMVIEPDDPVELANAISAFQRASSDERSRFGQNGRTYLLENFSRRDIIARYEKLLADVAARSL